MPTEQTIHLRWQHRLYGDTWTETAVNPNNLEAKAFCACNVEAVRGHEHHLVVVDAQRFLDERITIGMRLELSFTIHTNDGVEVSVGPEFFPG